MAAPGGGDAPPSSPISPAEAFSRLIGSSGKRKVAPEIPKFIKKLDKIPEIDLPEEQPIKIALALADRGLVGQFMGLWPSAKTTDDWIQRNWRPHLKHSVTCYPVGRGFYIFEFISKVDRDLIFRNGPYFMGSQGLYLNRWTPDFDPSVDAPKEVPVWVRLPNLPVHYWNPHSLEKIGNKLGRYIDKADPKGQYTCARVCVEVDLEAGLPEAIKLKVGTLQHYQKLDYEQLPFKCRHCHEHGHFQKNCPKAQQPEENDGWQTVKKGKAAPKAQEKRAPNNMKKQDSIAANKGNPAAAKNTTEEQNKTNGPHMTSSSQGPVVEIIESDKNQSPEARVPLEPGEIPHNDSEKETTPSPKPGNTPTSDPKRIPDSDLEPAKSKDLDEDPSNFETDQGGYTDEDDWESSSSIAALSRSMRGRKPKKQHREKKSRRDIVKGVQKTLPTMMGTRSKQGQAPKGASPPKKV